MIPEYTFDTPSKKEEGKHIEKQVGIIVMNEP
jgi:hypothetical protein